jgi:ParB-like chromosome segregation protein Spo0J
MSSHNWTNNKPAANPEPETEINRSSKNARRHGCCAVDASLLDTESLEDFKALESTWLKAYAPKDEAELHLVTELINADWLLQRSTKKLLEVESRVFNLEIDPLKLPESVQRMLSRFQRYRTANANLVHKARKAIDDHRKARLNEKLMEQKLTKAPKPAKEPKPETPKPEKKQPTWKEHLENMRQQAIALGYTPPDPDSI